MRKQGLFKSIALLATAILFLYTIASASDLASQRSPSQPAPAFASGESLASIVSSNGQWVLFSSTAENLATNASGSQFTPVFPAKMNVFLRDRTNGTTRLVSVNATGSKGGNGDSLGTDLSSDGRYVLFQSKASDLVANDTNGTSDVFLRDMALGTTTLVSVKTNGGSATGESRDPVMTPDARYVAFVSTARNIAAGDSNLIADIFVRDMVTSNTVLATPGAKGYPGLFLIVGGVPNSDTDGASEIPQITPDGRYVAFVSTATNVVPGLTNRFEVYFRDLVNQTTVAVSLGAHAYLSGGFGSYIASYNHCISDDGAYVAFESTVGRFNFGWTNTGMIFRCSTSGNTLEVVNSNAVAVVPYRFPTGPSDTHLRETVPLDMTPDGRFIAYVGQYGTNANTSGVFEWDAQSALITLVSGDLTGGIQTNSTCDLPTMSEDGRYVSFLSTATNLTTNTTSLNDQHLYVRDLQSGSTLLVDMGTNGPASAKNIIGVSGLSPDGRFISFDCTDTDLVPGDNNRGYDVFLSDLLTGTVELISAPTPALPPSTPRGATTLSAVSPTQSGRCVVFSSSASDLVGNDTNQRFDVFVRDLQNNTNILVSVNTNGTSPVSGFSSDAAISSDGRHVAFASTATDLTPNDTNKLQDIFVRDLVTGSTKLVATNLGPASSLGGSELAAFSDDGRYVQFRRRQPIIPNYSLFHHDVQLGITTLVFNNVDSDAVSSNGLVVVLSGLLSQGQGIARWTPQGGLVPLFGGSIVFGMSADGNRFAYKTTTNVSIYDIAGATNLPVGSMPPTDRLTARISADGRVVAYATTSKNSLDDTNNWADVYLFDEATGTNMLISSGVSGKGGNAPSDSPVLSPDGRFVAFRSKARNIVSTPAAYVPQWYLYDRQTGTTTPIGTSGFSSDASNARGASPVFSGDSGTLFFRSWASDIVASDFNQAPDVFSWKLATGETVPVFVGQIIFAPPAQNPPTISWPALVGKTYEVEFKNDLANDAWTHLNTDITLIGDRGFAQDLAPNPTQRFYRIKSD